ncbi:hypothetical protein B0H19DRAFT_1150770 [Mycena capillaripes]|nr:hypothetical protein B0H19DRAFT_1150770 [Mycena capillaripes]
MDNKMPRRSPRLLTPPFSIFSFLLSNFFFYMLRFPIFFALAASAFAAPTRSSTCPPRDDAGGALIEQIAEKNEQFLDCRYQNAGLCTYFAVQGSFSSGSSVCPDSALASSSGANSGGSSSSSGAAKCVATDDAGSALQNSNIGSDGFVSCKYQTAGTCEYFSPGGQFSAGSSICPDSITPGRSSSFGSASKSDATPSLSNNLSTSSGLAQCVATDDAGSPLQNTGTTQDGLVACEYQTAGHCEYFTPGGQFSSGSSTCPDSITSAASSGSVGSSSSSDQAQCVAADDAGSALQNSSITDDGFVACKYQAAGLCEYFTPGGQFSSGSSTCPDSITAAGNSSSSGTVDNSSSSSTSPGSTDTASSPSLAQCVAADDAGSALQSSSKTDDGFVVCKYQAAGTCEYFTPGGQFSSGSSTCPDGITPAGSSSSSGTVDNSSSSGTSTGSTNTTSSLAQCVATDDAGSALQNTGITADGFVTCIYQAAGTCEYFTPGGQFSAGSSTCPDSITPASSSSPSGSSVGSFLADSDNSSSSSSGSSNKMSQPVVIALLAMNAVLVIAVLAAGTVWVLGRRPKRSSSLRGLYAKVDATRETSVPLTHDAAEVPYSDLKPRSVFEDS